MAKKTLRVVTYNVHFGKDINKFVKLFQENQALREADVILFQEIEHHFSEILPRAHKIAEKLGFHFYYAPARPKKDAGTHGLATLSKFPILKNSTIELPKFTINFQHQQRIALLSQIQVNGKFITFVNIHLDARLTAEERINQLDFALLETKLIFGPDIVLGGDLNTIPYLLMWNLIPVGKEDHVLIVHEHMLLNSFVNFANLSFPTFKKGTLKMRLDHLYTDNFPIVDWGVEHLVRLSDHFPLWADIQV